MTPIEVQEKFELLPSEIPLWAAYVACLYQTWGGVLRKSSRRLQYSKWLAIYEESASALPLVVCRVEEGFQPSIGTGIVRIPQKRKIYVVKPMLKSLEELPENAPFLSTTWDDKCDDLLYQCFGYAIRVRMIEVLKGPKKESILLFHGPTSKLDWGPALFQWPKSKPFMSYSSKLGRELLRGQAKVPKRGSEEVEWPFTGFILIEVEQCVGR